MGRYLGISRRGRGRGGSGEGESETDPGSPSTRTVLPQDFQIPTPERGCGNGGEGVLLTDRCLPIDPVFDSKESQIPPPESLASIPDNRSLKFAPIDIGPIAPAIQWRSCLPHSPSLDHAPAIKTTGSIAIADGRAVKSLSMLCQRGRARGCQIFVKPCVNTCQISVKLDQRGNVQA